MDQDRTQEGRNRLLWSVAGAALMSLSVLGIVGRKSYKRKVVQLAKEALITGQPAPVGAWAVLTPAETARVFLVPLGWVLGGSILVGAGAKKWIGIKDWDHGIQTIKWVTKRGPPPTENT